MNEFIHTFSIITYMTTEQREQMSRCYGDDFYYDHVKQKWIFRRYADRGLRAEMEYTSYNEKKYNKKHGDIRAEWIITPAKLIFCGKPMAKLYTPYEYAEACRQLQNLSDTIREECGVDLFEEAKLNRVDLTKDIQTPSEEYSREVIRLAKLALDKYGYRAWTAEEAEVYKEEWKDENAVFFRNHNQEVQTKIYNKIADLELHGQDTSNLSGLIRFELTLKRKHMKKQGWILEKYTCPAELADILNDILAHASDSMRAHITDPLWSGAMLSEKLQKKMIRCRCKSKAAKYKKMMEYRKICNSSKTFDTADNSTAKRYFEEMGLSPLYTTDAVLYIPSFADLLMEREDERIRQFLRVH